MNPHYHHPPYPDLNSPHSPSSDGVPSSYRGHTPTGGPPNGHIMASHHELMHQQHPAYSAGGPGPLNHHGNVPNSINNYHHHYHHFLNNNNLSSNNSNNGTIEGNHHTNSIQNHGNAICAGCNNKIIDRWMLKALERHWHQTCLKCSMCNNALADMGTTCFTKDNMILCKNDYCKRFGQSITCAGCSNKIPPNMMVMRAGGPNMFGSSPTNPRIGHSVYHVECFVCSKCNQRLLTGDKYYLATNGAPVCEKDWVTLFKGSNMPAGQQAAAGTTVRKGKVGRPRRSRD